LFASERAVVFNDGAVLTRFSEQCVEVSAEVRASALIEDAGLTKTFSPRVSIDRLSRFGLKRGATRFGPALWPAARRPAPDLVSGG
jgi:hypothetical protein